MDMVVLNQRLADLFQQLEQDLLAGQFIAESDPLVYKSGYVPEEPYQHLGPGCFRKKPIRNDGE